MTELPPRRESLHDRYDRDERRLLDSAADEISTNHLLNEVIDVSAPIIAGSAWDGLPADAPPGTAERLTAAGALTAIAVRTVRTAALTVRSGYAAEALADIRRLFEVAGHAQHVVDDESGEYAANWLASRGRAKRPRVAFGQPDSGPLWKFMSGHAHAEFDAHAEMSATFRDGRLVNQIGPQRNSVWDSLLLWYAARHLVRVLAALLKMHPHLDQSQFLEVAQRVVDAEAALIAAIKTRDSE